jgi:MFS family permease
VGRGAGVATVSGIGYLGFIFGPPAIGFVSQLTSLRYALWIVVALTVTAAILSGAVSGESQPEETAA